jgi:hypothetical protein
MRILIICSLFFFGCKNNQEINKDKNYSIDYTYDNGWSVNWSIKIDSTNSIFFKQDDKCYQSNLPQKERKYLDSILSIATNNNTQNKFVSDKTDQALSYLIIGRNNITQSFLIYGDTYPPIFTEIFSFLKLQLDKEKKESACTIQFKSNEILKSIDTTSNSIRKFLPPNK